MTIVIHRIRMRRSGLSRSNGGHEVTIDGKTKSPLEKDNNDTFCTSLGDASVSPLDVSVEGRPKTEAQDRVLELLHTFEAVSKSKSK